MKRTLAKVLRQKNVMGKAVAAALGVTDGTISKWKNGQTVPSRERRHQLSKMLGVPAKELFPYERVDPLPRDNQLYTPDEKKYPKFLKKYGLDWQDEAKCRDMDEFLFLGLHQQKEICNTGTPCTVKTICAKYGEANRGWGVYGGGVT